jgi:hypothetical protein
MPWKEFLTLAISITALSLSLASFIRSRKIDRLTIKQSLIDRKYTALAKNEEQQLQMFHLVFRLIAIEAESDDATSLKATLIDSIESSREHSKTLEELNIDNADGEVDLILRERLGIFAQRAALLATAETKVDWLEKLVAAKSRPASSSN